MKSSTLTPEESLLLISKTIEETKDRFKEFGNVFIFWGSLTLLVFAAQLMLSLLELYQYMMVPVYLFPLGGIITFIWGWRENKRKNKPKTIIGTILQNIGWIIGLNMMVMGFLFYDQLGASFGPVFIILLALMGIVSGLSIKFLPLTLGGALTNVIGMGSFLINPDYHGFCMMAAAVVGMIIPGIMLNIARRRDHV